MSEGLGQYRILKPLAEGGFGELLLAEQPDGQRVVIKRLKIERVIDDKSLELFVRESGVLSSLRHPAVPRLIDFGVDDEGVPYLVQEHIDGPTLEQALEGGHRFDSRRAERLARDLLDALGYLHGLHPPVVHRDIKPANIILEGDRPVIVDFGAVCGHALLKEEVSDTVVGTFGYMAPEMLKGHASPASDLYALGATLLFAFTGREPESFPTERLRIRFRDVLNLPKRLVNLLEALLEPAVEDRPQSAAEALAILEGRPVQRTDGSGLPVKAGKKGLLAGRRLGPLPAKPVVVAGSLVTIGVLVLLFPAIFKMIALVSVVLLVVLVVLIVAVGGF